MSNSLKGQFVKVPAVKIIAVVIVAAVSSVISAVAGDVEDEEE